MSGNPNLRWSLLAVALALVIYFVWLTPYKYEHTTFGERQVLVRINRLSGKTEVLWTGGWLERSKPEASLPLSEADLQKLTGNLTMTEDGFLEADIYNGTDKSVKKITISVTVVKPDGALDFTRLYRLNGYSGPLEYSQYRAKAGFSAAPQAGLELGPAASPYEIVPPQKATPAASQSKDMFDIVQPQKVARWSIVSGLAHGQGPQK